MSVCPFVTNVLWLTGRYMGKLIARIISSMSRLSVYRICLMQCKGSIFKFGVEWRGRKNVHFEKKTGHILETVRD